MCDGLFLTSRPRRLRSCCWWRPRRPSGTRAVRFGAWPSGMEVTESGMGKTPLVGCCWVRSVEKAPGSYVHYDPETFASGKMKRAYSKICQFFTDYMVFFCIHILYLVYLLTHVPSGPKSSRKFPMNSRDFSSHFWIRSWLFSSTLYTKCLDFSSTVRTFSFILSTWFCRRYFFSCPKRVCSFF